ncbi:MAG: nuclear transport factor 2 family protein [Actinomycetota bacterium]
MKPDRIVERYFAAMRRGPEAEAELLDLFAPDAVYAEPFSGDQPAEGIDAIRARFRHGWEAPLPDLELDVLELEVAGSTARSLWECRSPGLPGPVRGEDRYEFSDGRISRLDVTILDRGH